MPDVGLTHVALAVSDLDRSIDFYARYAHMQVVHRRDDVVWISDRTRPFVVVLVEAEQVGHPLGPLSHLGVACKSRDAIDDLVALADGDGCLERGPEDSGPPVGYWAFLRDPDGHILELSFGQEVQETVERASVPD